MWNRLSGKASLFCIIEFFALSSFKVGSNLLAIYFKKKGFNSMEKNYDQVIFEKMVWTFTVKVPQGSVWNCMDAFGYLSKDVEHCFFKN